MNGRTLVLKAIVDVYSIEQRVSSIQCNVNKLMNFRQHILHETLIVEQRKICLLRLSWQSLKIEIVLSVIINEIKFYFVIGLWTWNANHIKVNSDWILNFCPILQNVIHETISPKMIWSTQLRSRKTSRKRNTKEP